MFVQVLLLAQTAGYLKLGNISLDGSKLHANASKSHAVSYQRLLELESQLRQEVEQLFVLAEQVDGGHLARWSQRGRRSGHPPAAVGTFGGSESGFGSTRRRALRRQNKPSLKRSSASAMPKPNATSASHLAAHQNHRRPAHVTATSTISPILTRAS